mmetsp:Transcript_45247/g.107693  ORF Transcript_45247/g.107693 Transcript_45247/m.107693 type:complete len:112 (+) Transcript_45247:721-1056(+)
MQRTRLLPVSLLRPQETMMMAPLVMSLTLTMKKILTQVGSKTSIASSHQLNGSREGESLEAACVLYIQPRVNLVERSKILVARCSSRLARCQFRLLCWLRHVSPATTAPSL